jgi:macrolide phosphotransferase
MTSSPDLTASIISLARQHNLELTQITDINELGLDFRVATVIDSDGLEWILRIPRRPDVIKKIRHEAKVLSMLQPHLPFAVPDWRIVSDELVAYPKLSDPTAIHVDAHSHELTWNIDRDSDIFTASLGKALAALHGVPAEEGAAAGLEIFTPETARQQIAREIELIKSSFKINPQLEERWHKWLNDDTSWPQHSVIVHGDLYAGHILVNKENEVTGFIDWTEAQVNDPAIDFNSQLLLLGEAGLTSLIHHYEAAGGRIWPNMARHVAERLAAYPIKYALFALESGEQIHMEAVQAQLLQT